MALDIIGKIIQVMPESSGQSKAGKPWSKQEFVIETMEQYPRKVCMSVMNDKVQELKKFAVGHEIKASLNIESREYQGRWYTDIRAWKIELNGSTGSSAPMPGDTFHADQDPQFTPDSTTDDLPF
jgi:hypothetical protein